MENTVILFAAGLSEKAFKKDFDSKSAFDLCLEWAFSVKDCKAVCIFISEKVKGFVEEASVAFNNKNVKIQTVLKNEWTKGVFASEIYSVLDENKTDYALVSWADTPFLNSGITAELIETHTKYSAEYTFQDGYPYGVAPELIDKGACGIISALCQANQKEAAASPVTRDSLFSIMSADINSFEIETVIAQKDYRLLRLELEASSGNNFTACKNLFAGFKDKNVRECNLIQLCDAASICENVLKTLPAFYNVQISKDSNHKIIYRPDTAQKEAMSLENYKKLAALMAELSGEAVVSLSYAAEPLLNGSFIEIVEETLKYPGLKLFIETDGLSVTEDLCQRLSEKGKDRIYWVVLLDAMDKTLYSKIHGCNEADFDRALNSIGLLEKYFENNVFPQFVRMKINEASLENFYRFWKEKESPSKGQFIIQKYNNFCGLLPDEKSADLSPLERNPCWHLRRDMVILCDGSVPVCQQNFSSISGNVFTEGLESVWNKNTELLKNHINKNYSECCGICDEHYTFNF